MHEGSELAPHKPIIVREEALSSPGSGQLGAFIGRERREEGPEAGAEDYEVGAGLVDGCGRVGCCVADAVVGEPFRAGAAFGDGVGADEGWVGHGVCASSGVALDVATWGGGGVSSAVLMRSLFGFCRGSFSSLGVNLEVPVGQRFQRASVEYRPTICDSLEDGSHVRLICIRLEERAKAMP